MPRGRRAALLALMVSALTGVNAVPAFAAGGAVEGTVSLPSGAAAPDICVSANEGTPVRTDATGHYHLDLAAGSYRIRFVDCGARDLVAVYYPGRIDANEATAVTVASTVVTGVDQTLTQGGSVSGHVVDRNGVGVQSAQVWVFAPGASEYGSWVEFGRADVDGAYTVHGVPAGPWKVATALYPDYPTTLSGNTDNPSAATTVDVTPQQQSTMDLRLSLGATLSGRVLDDDGTPRVGACVQALGSADDIYLGETHTDANGDYTLNHIWPGQVRVFASGCTGTRSWYVSGDSYAHATPIDATGGGAITGLNFTASSGPHIAGRVATPAGDPIANAEVQLYDAVSGHYTSTYTHTDADGRYRFPGLQAKLYKVHAAPDPTHTDLVPRFWPAAGTATLGAVVDTAVGSADNIDFTLPVGGSVTGTVTTLDGSPVSDVCVYAGAVVAATGGGGGARTDAAGHYRISALPDGVYTVRFAGCGDPYSPVMWQGGDNPTSGQTITVALASTTDGVNQSVVLGGKLHGRVTGAGAGGLAQMCVSAAPTQYSLSYGSAVTDSTGAWSMQGLASVGYNVTIKPCSPAAPWAARRLASSLPVTAPDDTDAGSIELHHGGSFSGTVIDQFGHPVTDVCISAVADDYTSVISFAYANSEGRYQVGGLEPGTYSADFYECGAGLVPTYWQSLAYETRAKFTVTADQVTTGIDQSVVLFTVPSLPLDVAALPSDGSATVSWSPPSDDGHTAITGYDVTTPTGTTRVGGSVHSLVVPGLTNGSSYSFAVSAVNKKGSGPSATTSTRLPDQPTSLTISAPPSAVSGSVSTLSGRLSTRTGVGTPGRAISVYRRAAGTTQPWVALGTATSGSNGQWSLRVTSTSPSLFLAEYADLAASVVQYVAPRLRLVASGHVLTLYTAPARAGAVVGVQRLTATGRWTTWLSTRLPSSSRLTVTVPSGTWRVWMPAVGYWSSAASTTSRVS